MTIKVRSYNTIRGLSMAITTLLVALFWVYALSFDIYSYVLVGVIYEIAWLPMMLMLILVPLFSIIFFIILVQVASLIKFF
jgi:hypothetical protein